MNILVCHIISDDFNFLFQRKFFCFSYIYCWKLASLLNRRSKSIIFYHEITEISLGWMKLVLTRDRIFRERILKHLNLFIVWRDNFTRPSFVLNGSRYFLSRCINSWLSSQIRINIIFFVKLDFILKSNLWWLRFNLSSPLLLMSLCLFLFDF